MVILKRGLLVAGLLSLMSGCTALQEAGVWQEPAVEVAQVRLTGLDFDKADLLVNLSVSNPNPYGIQLGALDYALDVQDARLLTGKQLQGSTLGAGQEQQLQLPLELVYSELMAATEGLDSASEVNYALAAGMHFELPVVGAVRVPVHYEGVLPVPRIPELKVTDLKVNNIGLTGASLVLSLTVSNPNTFELLLEEFDYALALNGQDVARGAVTQALAITEDEEVTLQLPVDVSTLHAGFALLNSLRSGSQLDYALDFSSQLGTSLPLLESFPFQAAREGEINLSR